MPLLRHLLEELGLIGDPDLKISGESYDRIVAEAEESSEEEE